MVESKTIAQHLRTASTLLAMLLALGACSAAATAPAPQAGTPAAAVLRQGPGPCDSARPDPLWLEPVDKAVAVPPRRAPTRENPLAPLHDALAQLETRKPTEPVSIVLLGDSHVAGQFFAGRLREILQARFGSAGPGGMPGRATQRGYRNALADVQQAGTWTGVNSLRQTTPGPFGLSLYRLRSDEPGASLMASATETAGFDRLTATLVRLPDAGHLRVSVGGCPLGTIATAGSGEAARLVAELPRGAREVTVEATDGPIELLGWRLTRSHGLLLENHGVNGAQLSMLGNLDPDIVAGELRQRDPALVIVAFGTNEAFSTDLTAARYRAIVEDRISALRQAAPRAAILIVGPPDSAVAIPAPPRRAAPARASNAKGSAKPPPGRTAAKGARPAGCRWKEPPNLSMVKTVLRQTAGDLGLAYWDWSQTTRGPCGIDAMTRRDPPLAQPDHVHFTAAGYAQAAEQLARYLTDGYSRRRRTS